jgi:acyl-coenzyme A thioesterase PaaI-like protein
MNESMSIQETHWPDGICFGCGPTNDKGLHIRSFVEDSVVVAQWQPQSHHQAFPGILNGGIIGTLLDCHSNAAAWWALSEQGRSPGTTVTAGFAVKLAKPTPVDQPLRLVARAVEITGRRALVEARIEVDGEMTATCEGTFVKLKAEGSDL